MHATVAPAGVCVRPQNRRTRMLALRPKGPSMEGGLPPRTGPGQPKTIPAVFEARVIPRSCCNRRRRSSLSRMHRYNEPRTPRRSRVAFASAEKNRCTCSWRSQKRQQADGRRQCGWPSKLMGRGLRQHRDVEEDGPYVRIALPHTRLYFL